ncbi:SLC13 family permease [Aliarcobacter skirrowii]|uniref:SLC13 family permease n=1 Tax=Aliarcobacter skirrowii TaxID=28200 RepID=UPI000D61A2FF|nr:SLC13 family permease [Aliarcobacter skirrowii]PWE19137.1 SLC13 family permease [Aliarcobacter skirrowii]PWE25188.1 SLC13 family permease [Aliarcobacter skirrowii]RJO55041.1 SLC13 family permease [Aliarcobacter skirrowii]RJO57038.1 SLC13 family permease [Aliarcobacter skirrowii]
MKLFIAITLLILIALLIQNKYRGSILFTGLASIYFILDLINYDDLVKGFTNNSLLTLVLLLLVTISLERTVLIDYFSKFIISKSYNKTFLKFGFIVMSTSAFANNTAVVASLMSTIKNNKFHTPSKLLIPLSYFAILGGTLTLIGTSTNLLVNSFVVANGHESLKIFDFFYVGFFIALFGLITLYFTKFLLPDNKTSNSDDIEEHLIELKVSQNSKLIGKSVKDNDLRNLEYFFLVEIIRRNNSITPVTPSEIIEENDKLIFSGDVKQIEVLKKFDGLIFVDDIKNSDIKTLNLVDTIVTSQSSLVGKRVKDANFRSKYDAAIVSFKRGSESILKIGEEVIQAGDRLILAVGNDFKNKENISKNFYLLSDIEKNQKYSTKQSIFVILGFISTILFSALGYISLFKALIIALIVLLFSKLLTINDIKRNFPFEIFLIIGSSIAISKVLASSGLANDIATLITSTLGAYGVYGSFIGIYLVTLILTEFMSNNSAAAIVFPIAYSTAIGLDVSIYPFVFAVAFGASASFLIPHGYQTNLMVTSLGSYKTKDFIKAGIPLSIVYSLVVIIATPIFFKF